MHSMAILPRCDVTRMQTRPMQVVFSRRSPRYALRALPMLLAGLA